MTANAETHLAALHPSLKIDRCINYGVLHGALSSAVPPKYQDLGYRERSGGYTKFENNLLGKLQVYLPLPCRGSSEKNC